MTLPERPIVGVGAVVFDADGRVLLIKRGHEPLKGQWSVPGGKVDLGETLEAAVTREVFEETGLTVVVGPLVEVLDRIERTSDDRVAYHFVILDYLCQPTGGVITCGSDAADVRWISIDELESYRLTEALSRVIARGRTLTTNGPPDR